MTINNKPINMHICSTCKDTLPSKDFYVSTQGRYSRCKRCSSKATMESRDRRKGRRRAPQRVPLLELNRRKLSSLDDQKSCSLETRFIRSASRGTLLLFPEGMILDGELFLMMRDDEDVLSILHRLDIKIVNVIDSNLSDSDIRESIASLRNSRREPISAVHIRGLVSRPHYYLWMDSPRPLDITEISEQLLIDQDIIEFVIGPPEKTQGTLNKVPPQNFKNLDSQSTQVPDITYELSED